MAIILERPRYGRSDLQTAYWCISVKMMHDLTELFVTTKQSSTLISWDLSNLLDRCRAVFPRIDIDWEPEENWASLTTEATVAILCRDLPLGIVFTHTPEDVKQFLVKHDVCIAKVGSWETPDCCFDPRIVLPLYAGWEWTIGDEGGLDPGRFSIHDLWWSTI